MQQVGQGALTPLEFMGPPEGFNPTLLLLIAAITLAIFSSTGFWVWHWSPTLVFILNFISLYVMGTVIHDASHGVAHKNKVVNAAMGHTSALLQGFVYPVFTRVHMQHHANVNDPENDPDHFVSTGGPLWLIAVRFFYHEIFFFQRKLWRKWELGEWVLSRLFLVIVLSVAYYYGFLGYILNYWFVPAGIMGLALGLFFDYLPHRPFQERSRWKNARVYPGWLLNVLLLGQNYHLVHHLWPSIPWYYYSPAYYKMKPLFDQNDSPQSLGLWKTRDLGGFIYDLFLGIRFHHK